MSQSTERMYKINITLSGEVLRPVLAEELEKTAKKFLKCGDSELKMKLAEEFTGLFAAAKGDLIIQTTANLPINMLKDKVLEGGRNYGKADIQGRGC